jgi:hypothetical protein
MEALRLNPNDAVTKEYLAKTRNALEPLPPNARPAPTQLDIYPSRAPRRLSQVRPGPDGYPVIDGIEVEFYENGRLKYFADVEKGKLNGVELEWDPEGRLLSRKEYRKGVPVDAGSGP